MSLTNALQIGRSGLVANQAAVEVAGNNLANASTPGYTRQTAMLAPATPVEVSPGMFIGTGVKLQSIIRNIDAALDARIRNAVGDNHAALARQDLLTQIESIYNEFSTTGLSSRMTEFFNAWSQLANDATEGSLQTMVISQGTSLTHFIRSLRSDLDNARVQLDDQVRGAVQQADSLLTQIAGLNAAITTAEGGQGGANQLRDERDQLITQLSELIDVSTVEQANGATDVLLGGTPLVLGNKSRGLSVDFKTDATTGNLDINVRVAADGTFLNPTTGKIGSLITARGQDLLPAIDALDQFAGSLIYQLNRVHSQGQGEVGFDSVTGTYQVDDPAQPMTLAAAGLDFVPANGTFKVHVTQVATGTRTTSQVAVDLDGIGGADMSLDDLVAAIDLVPNISAVVTVDGRLQISADSPDYKISFSDDSSGALAALGINTYFTGQDATDIDINGVLQATPAMLSTTANHVAGGNATALALAGLGDAALDDLGGLSLNEMWSRHVEDYAVRTSQAGLDVSSTQVVVESLQSQREAVSGVSVDEESINLIAFQRAYQGSARFINVVDELMQTLLGLIR